MSRKELFAEVQFIINQFCDGCFLYQHLKAEKGKKCAHRFCISGCTVGEKIKSYGNKLS